MSDPIIEMPSLRTRLVKVRDWIMTALWWIFWLFLIREVFFIAINIVTARSDQIRMATVNEILTTFAFYFQIIVINGLILILWARYNRFRFRGKDRRSAKSAVSGEEIAESLDMTVAQVEGAQRARRLTVHHDEFGAIERIDIAPGDTMSTGLLTSGAAAAGNIVTGGSKSRPSRPTSFGTRPVTGPFILPTPSSLPSSSIPSAIAPPVTGPLKNQPANIDDATIVSRTMSMAPSAGKPNDDEATIVSRPMNLGPDAAPSKKEPSKADTAKSDEATIVSKPMPPPDADGGKPR